jgi:fatty acid amide hydrolase
VTDDSKRSWPNALDGATVIAADVKAGRRSAVDVVREHAARHAASHHELNALVQPRHEQACWEAVEIDRGPLAGVPVSVKECFPVRGLRTTLGVPGLGTVPDAHDADIVSRIRAAGGVIVGKSNVPQAMYLHETDNPVFGRTSHPFMADRGPGGSSGGDAALVAAGVVPLAVGNDLAGSLRQPAHACGIAAIMPRSSVLGDGGAIDNLPSLRAMRPRAGFLARHVADLEVALAAVTPSPIPQDPPVRRIGWWDTTWPIPASPAIRRGVAEVVARLKAAGIEAVPLSGTLADEAAWLHLAILSSDGGHDIKRLLRGTRPVSGVRRLLSLAGVPQRWRPILATVARLVGRRIEADGIVRTGPRDPAGVAALITARDALLEIFASEVAGFDAIVCPVSALPALRHGTAARLLLAATPCLMANLFDLAAGAVPITTVQPDEQASRPRSIDPVLRAARAADRGSLGLPVGVQVIAPPGRGEATVLSVKRRIER